MRELGVHVIMSIHLRPDDLCLLVGSAVAHVRVARDAVIIRGHVEAVRYRAATRIGARTFRNALLLRDLPRGRLTARLEDEPISLLPFVRACVRARACARECARAEARMRIGVLLPCVWRAAHHRTEPWEHLEV